MTIQYSKLNLKKLADDEIIQLILDGENPKYFEEIYERYALKIYRKCLSFTKSESDAKDLAHDVIIKIYMNLAKFGMKSKFSTWVYAVTYNYCIDNEAKKKKQLTLNEELKLDTEEFSGEEPTDKEILEINIKKLNELLEKLTVAEKSILLMKYQDEFSIKTIAQVTKSGESAVKMKLKRSKEKLLNLYQHGK